MSENIISLKDPEAYRIALAATRAGQEAAQEWMQAHGDTGACGFAFVYIDGAMGERMTAVGARLTRQGAEYFTTASCGECQSLNAQEHVARAMVSSLEGNGVKARMESRMD